LGDRELATVALLRTEGYTVEEIAAEHDLHFRLAAVHCEPDRQYLKDRYRAGKIKPLYNAPAIDESTFDRSERVVAMAGVEPYQAALEAGADVVLSGRSTDAAIFASVPTMRGFAPGPAWHAAKILECGTACTVQRTRPDSIMGWIRDDHFEIEAMAAKARALMDKRGEGLRFLLEPSSSPSLLALRRRLQQTYPQARFSTWSTVSPQHVYDGAQLAFGSSLETRADLAKAQVIASFMVAIPLSGLLGAPVSGVIMQYFRGVYGDLSPSDYPSSGFTWNAATPSPGITNPNGDGSTTCPYNPATTGAYSCYDIYYLDQAAPHYDRGQIGAAFTGSYELDPSAAPTAGVWDWTNSYPGLIGAQLGFVNTLKRPSPNGSSFLVWLNGFATGSGGTVANDTASPSPLPASVESGSSDGLGGNACGSGQGTASDIVGGTVENAWTYNATNIPAPRLWAVNLNCVSDIQSEGSSIFAEVGGHSVGFDTPADGYDLSTAAHTGVTPAPAPTSIAVDSTLVNGAQLGNNAYALMIDPATNPEIVSVAASSSGSISAIFTLRHTPPYTVRTLSPYSYRITEYALDLLAYVPGKTVVQMKYFTSVFDLPVYAEAFLVPVLAHRRRCV